jgi:hypothetical protein
MKIRERKKVIQKHIERIEEQSQVKPKLKTKERVKGVLTGDESAKDEITKEEEPVQLDFRDMSENFILPPLTIMESPTRESAIDNRELSERAKVKDKLAEFAIDGSVNEMHPGPWSQHTNSNRSRNQIQQNRQHE